MVVSGRPLGYDHFVLGKALDPKTFFVRRPAAEADAVGGIPILERHLGPSRVSLRDHRASELAVGCSTLDR